MKDYTKEGKGSENEEVDFIPSPAYLYFLLFERVFSALLYHARSMRGSENPSLQADRCCLFSLFPPSSHPSVSLFPLQSSGLLCCSEMLLKM